MKNVLFFLLFLASIPLWATHNRAGEIRYEQIGELTIRATIITYTKETSVDADRDSLILRWGDGQESVVLRSNGGGQGVSIGNNTKLNLYTATHTYPGLGTFTLSMQDPNRNEGILNVNRPNSVTVPFYIETTFTLLSSQFQGFNRSAILLQAPIDFGCVDKIFKHDPGAFDPDGDSLAYELIVPLQDVNLEVPEYEFPNVTLNNSGVIDFDQRRGTFAWIVPQLSGEYNIAFRVKEYRNGVLIASTIRDMQIFIESCDNDPPVVSTEIEFCVVAGETLSFPVTVDDPDEGQLVRLEAQGGPFVVNDPALFIVDADYSAPVVTGTFEWETTCNHIREQPYEVIFRGIDNYLDSTGLVDIRKVLITVIGPPPEDPTTEILEDKIQLSWQKPYRCEITDDEYFQGFSVWRKIGSTPLELDSCQFGLEGQGYERIARNVLNEENGRYFYQDTDVRAGENYCYRILADFALLTVTGNTYNRVSSIPSEEVCALFNQDIPVIQNVSVLTTDLSSGTIDIRWILPDPIALDTLENPGPYRLELWRAEGTNPLASEFEAVSDAAWQRNTFAALVGDTMYVDSNLNTQEKAWSYELRFYTGSSLEYYGQSKMASSPFLTISSTDRTNILNLQSNVPWSNYLYRIYRQDLLTGEFLLLDSIESTRYFDQGLTNGTEYCYYIETEGTYGVDGWKDPLFNLSQRSCGTPIDTVAPCPPDFQVNTICESIDPNQNEDIINTVEWRFNENNTCRTDDVVAVRIYFSESQEEDLELLTEIMTSGAGSYVHDRENEIKGCYELTAVDSNGNESQSIQIICVDNCPEYILPNVFSPNSDGANDLFQPYPYRFVERVEMKIFNRWGQLVYETEDPDINWDGTNLNGSELADGVYYYKAIIYERRVDGVTATEPLSGFVHLIR